MLRPYLRARSRLARMDQDDPFGEKKKPGFLERLIAKRVAPKIRTTTYRREELKLIVPDAKADAVQAALGRWLGSKGIGATVRREDAGGGRVHLRADLGPEDAERLDLTSDAVQNELESLLTDAG
jgi:hypothetical protein